MLMLIEHEYPNWNEWPSAPVPPVRDGTPHRHERDALLRIARHVDAHTAFEIGTFDGATAVSLSMLPSMIMVWTLDIPEDTEPALPVSETDPRWVGMRKCKLTNNVEQLWGDSALFDFSPYSGRADLVFVMGAHSPEYIDNDLRVAAQLVSETGAVVLHTGTPAPMAAVAERYNILLVSDRMGWVTGMAVDE